MNVEGEEKFFFFSFLWNFYFCFFLFFLIEFVFNNAMLLKIFSRMIVLRLLSFSFCSLIRFFIFLLFLFLFFEMQNAKNKINQNFLFGDTQKKKTDNAQTQKLTLIPIIITIKITN